MRGIHPLWDTCQVFQAVTSRGAWPWLFGVSRRLNALFDKLGQQQERLFALLGRHARQFGFELVQRGVGRGRLGRHAQHCEGDGDTR